MGSLVLLGIFMLLGPSTNIERTLEVAAKTEAWSLLAVIPALALAYVLGLFSTTAVEVFGGRDRVEDLYRVASAAPPLVIEHFATILNHQRLLRGASLGFAILAAGLLRQGIATSAYLRLGVILSLGSLSPAILSFICAALLERRRLAIVALAAAGSGAGKA